MPAALSPEYALLLDALAPAVATSPDATGWDRSRWDRVVELARWHRVAPLLFEHLGVDGPAPDDVTGALKEAYLANGSRNLFIGAALERMLKALAAADVPVMLLKGVALIEAVYPDPALRQMSDVDVLVPKSKLDDANAALAGIGYGRKRAITRDQDTQEWMRTHHRHDPPLTDERQYIKVELHHHVVKGEARDHFDIDDLWRRSRAATLGPPHVLPSGEDLLMHACLHFTYHRMTTNFGALAQLGDIAWVLDRERIEPKVFIDNTRACHLESPVFLALFAARELGLAVPPQALEALRPSSFDERVGRRLVELRVLRTSHEVPRRSLRKALAPDRWGLERNWGATPGSSLSLLRAYVRRLVRSTRYVRHVAKKPRTVLQDYRLNKQLQAFGEGPPDGA